MFAAVLALSLCATPGLVPDRAPLGQEKTHDLEERMYDHFAQHGRLGFRLKSGWVEIAGKEVKDRKFIDVTITRYDDNRRPWIVYRAKECEVRYGSKDQREVIFCVRHCHFQMAPPAGLKRTFSSLCCPVDN
jgi:hypothetical protein